MARKGRRAGEGAGGGGGKREGGGVGHGWQRCDLASIRRTTASDTMDQFLGEFDSSRDQYASYEPFAFEPGMEGSMYRANHSMEGSGMEELSDRGHAMPPPYPPSQNHTYHPRGDRGQNAQGMRARPGFDYHERAPLPDQYHHPSSHHPQRSEVMNSRAPPPAPVSGRGKRAREEKAAALSDSTSSKRSRAEKHYKEIRLLCDALSPHTADVNVSFPAIE